jgi:quercetin dioxygenase-like cupin family protein
MSPRSAGGPPAAGADVDDLAGRLARTELQRSGSSVPGRIIVQVLTEIPPGVESGWHTHPGEEGRPLATVTP